MSKVKPLAALLALVVVGITVELVEQQNKQAAYMLVVLLLLGMITFNAAAFRTQLGMIIGVANAPARPKSQTIQR
jgi:hypothetical protein